MTTDPFDMAQTPVHLGLGATARRLPTFDGSMAWYERYEEGTRADGVEGRLVSMHTFESPWSSWEMHPAGDELVVCVAGSLTLHQEIDGAVVTTELSAGQAVINPPGVWHTADVTGTRRRCS